MIMLALAQFSIRWSFILLLEPKEKLPLNCVFHKKSRRQSTFSLLMQLPNQVSCEGKFNQGEKRANIASTPSWLFPVMRYLRDENRWSFHLLCKESASFPICFYRWPFACCVCAVVSSHWLLRFPSRGRRGIRGETSRPDQTKYAQTKRFVLVIYCTYYVSFWHSNLFLSMHPAEKRINSQYYLYLKTL